MKSCLIILAAMGTLFTAGPAPVDYTRFVNPFIGTGGHGHTYPGPSLPFGMVQVGPDTRLTGWDGCSGYHYSDDIIYGFSHTHLSGTGVADYGDILLLPATGDPKFQTGYGKPPGSGYGSRFRHENETAQCGYYAVQLDDYGVHVELTTTWRAAMHRYTFSQDALAHVLIDLVHRDEVLDSSFHVTGPAEIEGMRRSKSWARDQRMFFVARFSRPFSSAELVMDGQVRVGLKEVSGQNLQAVLRFRARKGEPILVKVGISAVSVAGARRNLDAEIPGWDFEEVRTAARQAWNEALAHIRVSGGTPEQQVVFYTALYHAMLAPNLFMDVDGQYLGTDRQIHQATGFENYTVFSLWDTFRAAHPLYTIIEPKRTVDFIQTFLQQYQHGGMLPVWELAGNETGCMIGYHAVSVIADAYLKGLRGFNAELALSAMKHSAELDHLGLASYRRYGYIPANQEAESVSKTLEYAYDDWCIAQMAKALDHRDDYRSYLKRAQSYKNVFNPATAFMQAKANAAWIKPFDPTEVNIHYTEANAWQYSFFVPQDISGLMDLLGGKEKFARKLDALFSAESRTTGRDQADITGLVGQYAHGNEPSHHLAYLYNFAGQPWKTQRLVRRLLDEMYANRPDGLSGNEDCAQMSAWYILSALGFYPVTPGSNRYIIGSPLLPEAVLSLAEGKEFRIRARGVSPANVYIQSATLNGRPYLRSYLEHADIVKGGVLEFEMGPQPNPSWGTGAGNEPVSAITEQFILPEPYLMSGETAFPNQTDVAMACLEPSARIFYTLDGSEPSGKSKLYTGPFALSQTTTVKFIAYKEEFPASHVQEAQFHQINRNWKITLNHPYHPAYPAVGENALIDGIRGGDDFRLGTWQGYEATDLDAVVDLGQPTVIHRVATGFLQDINSWVFMPAAVEYSLSSDGVNFRPAVVIANDVPPKQEGAVRKDFAWPAGEVTARYLRVVARNPGPCPPWHKGAGGKSFIFADEIVIE